MSTYSIPFNHHYLSVDKDQITHKTWLLLNTVLAASDTYLFADGSRAVSGLLSFANYTPGGIYFASLGNGSGVYKTLANYDAASNVNVYGNLLAINGGDVELSSFWGVDVVLDNGGYIYNEADAYQTRIPNKVAFNVSRKSASGSVTSLFTVLGRTGNVGIAKQNPTTLLEVNGDVSIGQTSAIYYGTGGNTGTSGNMRNRLSSSNFIQEAWSSAGNWNQLTTLTPSGRFGLGSSVPVEKLDVSGNIQASGINLTNGTISITNGYINFGDPTTDGSIRMSNAGGSFLMEKRISSVWVSGFIVTW